MISSLHELFAFLDAALPFPPAFLVLVPVAIVAWQFFNEDSDVRAGGSSPSGSGGPYDLGGGDSGGDGGGGCD